MIVPINMRLRPVLALALICTAASLSASDHSLPTAKDASTYSSFDAHTDEQVVIAAEPYDTKEKQSIFRIDYTKNGFMPVWLVVTNNSDRPISLRDARIDLISAADDKIPAAEPEDVERRMTHVSNTGKKIPMPAPLPPMGGKPKTPDSKIEEDFSQFEYAAIAVEPHTTHGGFLFYDVQGLGSNPLHGALLELRTVRNADGKELRYFDIPFDKYLKAQTK